nr:phosphate ABC transporter substrate-binding protein PstS [Nocardiopsis ansamitocini]
MPAIALLGALALTTGCGSDNAVRGNDPVPVPADLECVDGTVTGSGSSAQEKAMQVWIAGFQGACDDARVYYDSIGSGGGRSQFIDGAVAFAGSDAALDPAEAEEASRRCTDAGAINIPVYVVPIAVVFNLPGVESLNMGPETIARVFTGAITDWNDPEIAEANPDAELPDLPIAPVSRSDESGTTENFTAYLEATAGDAWPYEHSGQWPIPPAEAGQGNSGVAQAVESGGGTIGYLESSHAQGMSTVKVGVGDGFVELSPEAAAGVIAASPEREGNSEHDHALDLDYATSETGVYPIVLVSYEIMCQTYPEASDASAVKAFVNYILSDEGQQAASEETGSAPLSPEVRENLVASVATVDGGR